MKSVFGAPAFAALVLACGVTPAFAGSSAVVEPAAVAAPALDADAARLALARRFVSAMQGEQMGASLGRMTVEMMPRNENLTDEQNAAIRRAMEESMADLLPRMFDAMAPVYADIFTMEELTALVDFYESDVGRSLMAKSLEAAPRISEIAEAMIPGFVHGMMDNVCKAMECTAAQRQAMDEELARSGLAKSATGEAAKGSVKGH